MSDQRSRRTLVVEDDPEMRMIYGALLQSLSEEGFTALFAEDAERALEILRSQDVDLVMLDWGLPGISGEALLRALRANLRTRSLGVLMVTGRNDLTDELHALDIGADDYLAKPFEEDELLARLRSLGRRLDADADRRLEVSYPGFEFEFRSSLLRVEGKPVQLTAKERDLLGIFLRRPNFAHGTAELWEELWGYRSDHWESRLFVTLASLRRKLGEGWGGRLQRDAGGGFVFRLETAPPGP
ncbi:MAG: response regulator transcription factor [Elusimicrobia bacterium]|nr:response regulator transcription factor [Elusimicrobiota bacterium]